MHLKTLSAKRQPFWLGLNVLKTGQQDRNPSKLPQACLNRSPFWHDCAPSSPISSEHKTTSLRHGCACYITFRGGAGQALMGQVRLADVAGKALMGRRRVAQGHAVTIPVIRCNRCPHKVWNMVGMRQGERLHPGDTLRQLLITAQSGTYWEYTDFIIMEDFLAIT